MSTTEGVVSSNGTLVRPIGATERLFYRYSEANPTHFLLVAEFDSSLAEERVRRALHAIQRRHPLLAVHIHDHPVSRLGFYRRDDVAPIPLAVRHATDASWQTVAADELGRPFDRTAAPLIRATLLRSPSASTLLLTFDHTIADGVSSVRVLEDLVAALNDQPVEPGPTPRTVEDLLVQHVRSSDLGFDADRDARMAEPSTLRRFDGTRPRVYAVSLSRDDTARLVRRCRDELTTVHAALLAAASSVRSRMHGESFVRSLSPIDVRKLIGDPDDCAIRFSCTTTGLAADDERPFWTRARAMTAELSAARSAAGVLAASAAVAQAIGTDADRADAEDVFTRQLPWELLMTNLGRQQIARTGPLHPTALWGPIVQSQTAGEYVTGIVTYERRLRMVAVGYQPTGYFLDGIVAALEDAVGG
ncbi:hypothetical protein AU197_25340 [Mycobacterium sp. IS-1590]|uniref:condensation domain-containing protein n=1 Tax=Mycobacterium sp. IS-1590 TaxID=1772286 RepID=UPI0007486658|nr:condensation domain-containing protein [Mycobacterium sp. IS-1590]KUI43254.1 hypothetical protein AU197_25340 [Mycobacterium sp. IS-1590]